MLIPKKLTLRACGRFVESQTIDFTKLGSLNQLEAVNNNTGGSSGSGKTTLAHALEYNLGLNDLPISVLQSRLTKEPLHTLGEYDLDGTLVIIERGKSKFSVTVGDQVTTGSSKLTEEELDKILGMPRDLFRKIAHKRQGERGWFLAMTPADTGKFLTSCLGLEKEQTKIVTLDARLATLETSRLSTWHTVETHKSAIEATKQAADNLGSPPALEIDPGTIEELKKKHLEATENHKLVKLNNKNEMDELEKLRPQIKTTPFDRSGIERIEKEISEILQDINKLEKVELDRQSSIKSKISQLQITISELNGIELSRQSEVKAQISALRMEVQKLQQVEQNRQSQVQTKISQNKIENIKASALVSDGNRAKEEAVKLAEELPKVRAAICPKCERDGWITDKAKTEEASILSKLQEYKKTVIAGMEASKRIISLEEEKKQLEVELKPQIIPGFENFTAQFKQLEEESKPRLMPEIAQINEQVERFKLESQPLAIQEVIELKMKADFKNKELLSFRQEEKSHQSKEDARSQSVLSEFAQKQTTLRQSHETTLKFVVDEENRILRDLTEVQNRVRSFEEGKKRFEESRKKFDEQINSYNLELFKHNQELALILEEIELATESKKAIKSYLSCSFEDALDSIGNAATTFIRCLPNMATATIQFEGLKETKEGKIKEEVTCLISMDGEVGIPIKSLSGGERSSTDLAIDLSVIHFIEERTGKGFGLFLLDEPFTGLDSKNILEALEMLKESAKDKKLLVVDHNVEAAQFMENKILVIRDGLTSRVVQ